MQIRDALLVLLAPALAAATPERIAIVARPPQLELRPGAAAELQMAAREPPRLRASVGTVGPPRLIASGIYAATYVAPRESFPQVALISATVADGFGWIALPLEGTGELEVKTKPRAEATARIGDRTFGPVRADARGRAVIPIVVPPGTTHAMVGERRVKLDAPPPSRPFTTIVPDSVAATVPASISVRVIAVNANGSPRRAAPVRLTVSDGVISAPREVEPGVFVASWNVLPGAPGESSVSATIDGDAAGASEATLLRGGAPVSPRPEATQPPAVAAAPPPRPAAPPRSTPPQATSPEAEKPRAQTAPVAPAPAPPPAPAPAPTPAPAVTPRMAQVTPPPRVAGVSTRPVIDRAPDRPSVDLGFSVRSGAAWDEEGLRAITAGVQASLFPAFLGGHLGVGLDVGGLAVREDERVVTADRSVELSTASRLLALQGLVLVRAPLLGGGVVLGGGGGSAYGMIRTAARGQRTTEVSGSAPALSVLLGYGHRLGYGALFLEVRGQHIGTIARQPVPGTLDLLGVSLGYRFEL